MVAIHLFEKIKQAEICRSKRISKFTQAAMEQHELDQGEPYVAEIAKGLHPKHPVKLEQIRAEKLKL